MNPTGFFCAVYKAFEKAEQAAGDSFDRYYCIGGYSIHLRFAGPCLVAGITQALQHLAARPCSKPDLTICVYDSASTGTSIPPAPWSTGAYVARGDINGYGDNRVHIAFLLGPGILSMLDVQLNLGLYWIRDGYQLPYYESGSPLRTILHWWMGRHNRQYVHAGAIGMPEAGVVLAGKGGSGKSTTALTCFNSPLVYVSDDYCLLSTDTGPYVYSLYNSAKLDADNIYRHPGLLPLISNAHRLHEEKALFFLYKHFPEKIVPRLPIQAVLIPRVTGHSKTYLKPASPIAGLQALAPNTIFQLAGAGQAAFEAISKFVKQVPIYYLEVGTEIHKIPDVIIDLLSKRN
jgi:hypothetical protein